MPTQSEPIRTLRIDSDEPVGSAIGGPDSRVGVRKPQLHILQGVPAWLPWGLPSRMLPFFVVSHPWLLSRCDTASIPSDLPRYSEPTPFRNDMLCSRASHARTF